MFNKIKHKKIPLQRYWTSRYVMTLVIGLLVVAIVSALWIRHTTFENRLNMMLLMAEETANQIVHGRAHMDKDSLLAEFEVREFLEEPGRFLNMKSDPGIYIVGERGDVLYSNTTSTTLKRQLNPAILYSDQEVDTFYSEEHHDTLYMVKKPIIIQDNVIGWVVFFELKGHLTDVDQQYKQLSIMIAALAIFGWLAIYFLSKRLAKPITDVAIAAEKVKEGNYAFELSDHIREKEVYELIHSFKEMALKLEQLETLRTELLAGVTHELKTPVTSISGLIQAVKDGVVEGKEAEEFLTASLKETTKMKLMVEDLVAFNSFVANAVPMDMKAYHINACVTEMVRQWEMTQEKDWNMMVTPLSNDLSVQLDEVRLQQIMTNLLNNATQAMEENAATGLHIVLGRKDNRVTIDVIDEGTGIPEAEQDFIFERFYRGENKKFQVSGFGLGLPFSKMLAQAMGGDLLLVNSTSKGTTFRVTLPIGKKTN